VTYDVRDHVDRRACWEIRDGFCADLTNGRKRCAKGTCFVRDMVAMRKGTHATEEASS
jgi:uncharacterized protein YrrD